MDFGGLQKLELILLVGAVVAIIARKLRVPYTVGLVTAGIAITFIPRSVQLPFSKDLLFNVLLPPLIFEAALYIKWNELRRDLALIISFATLGVAFSGAVTAALMHFAVGWEWAPAMIFGSLIAATDPVSVVAAMKEANVKGRLRLLLEAESLFNDSTAAVAFAAALALAMQDSFHLGTAALNVCTSVIGGIVVGLAVAGGVLLLAGASKDHLAELALSTIAAFGSFWLAEHFHVSGILATTSAGLLIGNTIHLPFISEKGGVSMEAFWEFAAFVSNSVVFVLLGMNEAYNNFRPVATAIAVAVIAVLLGRAAAIYPIAAFFSRSKWKLTGMHQNLLFWGGLRGALALALALGIPEAMPHREEIVLVTFGVVAFSVFVQGLSMPALLRRSGFLRAVPAAASR